MFYTPLSTRHLVKKGPTHSSWKDKKTSQLLLYNTGSSEVITMMKSLSDILIKLKFRDALDI